MNDYIGHIFIVFGSRIPNNRIFTFMKSSKYFTILILLTLVFGFGSFKTPTQLSVAGTYGTCTSENNPSPQLVLNSNFTFHYTDPSNPKSKLDIHGNWTSKGRRVLLDSKGAEQSYHKRWTISKDGKAIHARKGLCFYRLGNKIYCQKNE